MKYLIFNQFDLQKWKSIIIPLQCESKTQAWDFPDGLVVKNPPACPRPYHPERARSRLISEAKQGWAWLVLGWENPPASTVYDSQHMEAT